LQIKTTIVSCHTADSKLVKQEVNGTAILAPFVFPGLMFASKAGDVPEWSTFQVLLSRVGSRPWPQSVDSSSKAYRVKHSSLFVRSVSDNGKQFYNIGTRKM